jgi:hypothetical protein
MVDEVNFKVSLLPLALVMLAQLLLCLSKRKKPSSASLGL